MSSYSDSQPSSLSLQPIHRIFKQQDSNTHRDETTYELHEIEAAYLVASAAFPEIVIYIFADLKQMSNLESCHQNHT